MDRKILQRSVGAMVLTLLAAGCVNSKGAMPRTIGPEGGTVTSADGRLEIEVPKDAFSKPTVIAITPIAHDLARGIGSGYRVTPEGALGRPVRLSFLYADAELNGASPGGLGIAFREGVGPWSAHIQRTVDPGSRRVSVTTDHLSDWVLFEMLFLEPSSTQVKVIQTQPLRVMFCAQEDPDSLITPLVPECQPLGAVATVGNWMVDGAPGGNATVGTVSGQSSAGMFTAPQTIPFGNPVVVSVDVTLPGGTSRTTLLSRVEIVNDCPAPICHLVGTSSDRAVTGEDLWITGEAQVTWEFSSMSGTTATYVASGTSNAVWEHTYCGITLSPSTFTIRPGDGELQIDFSKNPPTYSGYGDTTDETGIQTWTCPSSDPFEETSTGATWFHGSGTVGSGGLLEGTFASDLEQSSWSFARP